jgi:hypothetical protein
MGLSRVNLVDVGLSSFHSLRESQLMSGPCAVVHCPHGLSNFERFLFHRPPFMMRCNISVVFLVALNLALFGRAARTWNPVGFQAIVTIIFGD